LRQYSLAITATTSIKLLALMQRAWVNVVHHNPAIQEGNWIAYYNVESKKGDTLWPGSTKIINPGLEPKDQVITDWYGIDENKGTLKLEPPKMERKHGTWTGSTVTKCHKSRIPAAKSWRMPTLCRIHTE
jgi:hypothetical protein